MIVNKTKLDLIILYAHLTCDITAFFWQAVSVLKDAIEVAPKQEKVLKGSSVYIIFY